MSIYSDKLAHVQAVINCPYSVVQMCTWEGIHSPLFMRAVLVDVMSQNEVKTLVFGYFEAGGRLDVAFDAQILQSFIYVPAADAFLINLKI